MLDGGAAGASPSPPKTASSRAAGAGSGGGAAARGVSRASGVGVSSTRAKSFDAGVENAGDTLVRRGTTCEGTRGRRGGAGDGVGAVGGESGRKLAVQLVSVSFWSLPRKLSLFVGLRAMLDPGQCQKLAQRMSLPKTAGCSPRRLPEGVLTRQFTRAHALDATNSVTNDSTAS